MWIFTKYGFFSAVCAAKGKGIDPDKIIVRARVYDHLVALQKRFGLNHKIVVSHDTDYRCRIFVPKETWVRVAKELAAEIDYGNFKDECHGKDPAYDKALLSVWTTMRRLQPARK